MDPLRGLQGEAAVFGSENLWSSWVAKLVHSVMDWLSATVEETLS